MFFVNATYNTFSNRLLLARSCTAALWALSLSAPPRDLFRHRGLDHLFQLDDRGPPVKAATVPPAAAPTRIDHE